jgi:hypothetical protein
VADFLSGIENSLDGVALPGVGLGSRRRDGWLSALMNAGDPLFDGVSQRVSGSESQPRLAQRMNQDPGMGTGGDVGFQNRQQEGQLPMNPYRLQAQVESQEGSGPKQNRIEDDKTRSPQGDAQPQTLSEKMNAGDYSSLQFGPQGQQPPQSLSEKMNAGDYSSLSFGSQGQQQPAADDYLGKLQKQYDDLGQRPPMKLWQKIALGASAPFGGLTSYVQARQRSDDRRAGQRDKLLDTITAQRRMDEQQPEVHDTDQGPIQYNRQTRGWDPIMVGGQRVGPKAQKPDRPDTPQQQYLDEFHNLHTDATLAEAMRAYTKDTQKPDQKPASLEQRYSDAVESGDKVTAQRLLGEMQAIGGAKQPPQRPPQQLGVIDGKVVVLRPGMDVTGAQSLTGDLTAGTNAQRLTPATQSILQTTEPVKQQVEQLLRRLEETPEGSDKPYKEDNTPGTMAWSRAKYAIGMASPEGSLGEDISKIEMDRVIAGARILKGSSRAYQALELAMKHAPVTWKDSPQLMYQKLTTILQNLTDVEEDAKAFGVKGQTLQDANQKGASLTSKVQNQAPEGARVTNGSEIREKRNGKWITVQQ